jgi:hypothetical protein
MRIEKTMEKVRTALTNIKISPLSKKAVEITI